MVNYSQLLQESPQAKAAVASCATEFAPKQRTLQSAAAAEGPGGQPEEERATMTQDQRDRRELDLRERYQDLQRKQSEIQDDFNARRNEALSQLQRTLVEVVQNYAKEQRYDLVLADGVIYADAGLDITPQILSCAQVPGRAPARRTGKRGTGACVCAAMGVSLGELAVRFGCELRGDPRRNRRSRGDAGERGPALAGVPGQSRAIASSSPKRPRPRWWSMRASAAELPDCRADLREPACHLCAHRCAAASAAAGGRRGAPSGGDSPGRAASIPAPMSARSA